MLGQIVLTPTESKKLIAKAVANLDVVRLAATTGMVVLHPSSSAYFIVEEITGEKPKTNHWACGVVTPKGMCFEMGMLVGAYVPSDKPIEPKGARFHWIIKNGKLSAEEELSNILDNIKDTDCFIKGVNALDPQGNVGILLGDHIQGGTLGLIMSSWRKKKFNMIYPVGLEKLIPISIDEASKEAKATQYEYAMGLAAGLYPCPSATKVTEIDAIKILSGASAIPIAGGGLGGAEGAITLVLKGTDEQVKKAIGFVELSKGAKLPQLRLNNCHACSDTQCRFPVGDKHWTLP